MYKFQPLYAPLLYVLLEMSCVPLPLFSYSLCLLTPFLFSPPPMCGIADIDISRQRGSLRVNPFTRKQLLVLRGGTVSPVPPFFLLSRRGLTPSPLLSDVLLPPPPPPPPPLLPRHQNSHLGRVLPLGFHLLLSRPFDHFPSQSRHGRG